MPLIGTRGTMTAVGFGQFLPRGNSQGSLGVFARTSGSAAANSMLMIRYNLANDAVTLGSNLTGLSPIANSGAAAANSVLGVYAYGAGGAGATPQPYTYTYIFASFTLTGGGNLSDNLRLGTAFGNQTSGYFCHGASAGTANGSRTISKYSYAANTSTLLVAQLTVNSVQSSSVAGPTFGVDALGPASNGGAATTVTNKLTYAADTVAAGTALSIGIARGSAMGNAVHGVFVNFSASNPSALYQYAGDVTSTGPNFSMVTTTGQGNACGNDTIGVIATITQAQAKKYSYASSTVSAATAVYSGAGALYLGNFGAASNGVAGVSS